MKPNQITIKMGNYYVIQRDKDGMFNATDLLRQFNEDNKEKHLEHFLKAQSTKEYIHILEFASNNYYWEEKFKVIDIEKGKQGQVWMHPYLFFEFLAWLNPMFRFDMMKLINEQITNGQIFGEHNDVGDVLRILYDYKTYLIKDRNSGLVKIGKSSDISKTLLSLSSDNNQLSLLLSIDMDVVNELHLKYADKRRLDHWFELRGSDLLDIYTKYRYGSLRSYMWLPE
jgi:hypothetical protein